MPVWLRKYTFNKLKEWYKQDTSNEDSWVQGEGRKQAVKNKQIKTPTYVTKASKK
jgi:hypothetical protein